MKPNQLYTLLAFGLSAAIPAFASLKDTKSDVFVKLADLTRPKGEKQYNQPNPTLENDGPNTYQYEGADWTVNEIIGSIIGNKGDDEQDDLLLKIPIVGSEINQIMKSLLNASVADKEITMDGASETTQSSTFFPVNPPSVPLAVKSPYLSAWLPSGSFADSTPPNYVGNGGYLAGQWASFWTSAHGAPGGYRLGWTGYVRIDNTTYQWMGNGFGTIVRAGENAKQISMTYTSTRSIFEFEAAGVKFNVTFMSPIWPKDYFRQSIPLSYMHFSLDRESAKGKSVQIYTDIDERWVTGHYDDYDNYPYNMQWVDNANGSSVYFVQRTNPQVLQEYHQRAEWGSATYAMRKRKGMSSRNNNNVVAQLEFLTQGKMTYDHNPVGGPDNSFSYAVDFDGKGGDEALFAIGFIRTPYVNYIQKSTTPNDTNHDGTPKSYLQNQYGYWMTKYQSFSDLVAWFMDDYENALKHCIELDQKIDEESQKVVGGGQVGEQYSAITQLSVRQAFGALEWTVSYDEKKKVYNVSDTIVWLKEISSNGDMQTVDVFTPLFPLLTYLNPEILRDIMKPIYEYTESGLYPNKWCVHDLGVYPNAFGHNDGKDEPMQVEESGNMILLALHYAQLVGEKVAVPWLKKNYKIMQQWAEFLIEDSLVPALQLSTDDFAGTLANQTNLALKGIEGIAAIGHIATMLGKEKDAKHYANVSQTYIQAFYGYAINKQGTHVKLSYQDDKSWGTLYNLIFDRLLNLELVAKEIYQLQDEFYPTKVQKYGVPLDSRYTWGKTDWQMWASATAANESTNALFIEYLYKYMTDHKIGSPFPDLFETITGNWPAEPLTPRVLFLARPVAGAHLIHLALASANKANNVTEYQYGPPIKKGKGGKEHQHMLEKEANEARKAALEDLIPNPIERMKFETEEKMRQLISSTKNTAQKAFDFSKKVLSLSKKQSSQNQIRSERSKELIYSSQK